MSDNKLIAQFDALSKQIKFKVLKYDPAKARPVLLANGGAHTIDKFAEKLRLEAREKIIDYPEVNRLVYSPSEMADFLEDYAKSKNIYGPKDSSPDIEVPESYKRLTLNIDQSHVGRDLKFFMTTPEENVSVISGNVWLRVNRMKDEDAIAQARKVIPEYRPRDARGIVSRIGVGSEEVAIYNCYTPSYWMTYKEKTPPGLPPLFVKLLEHLFPSKLEREYFLDWLHDSLFTRAFVFLVLCGIPGSGKNRLKLVLRALHGHWNSVDGKRSTIADRFNSQYAESTLCWFDELAYTQDMENAMKEVQNDSISIEKKGVDATKSSKIHASIVISNNKPRDNFIPFDARKFVPLQVRAAKLGTSMTEKEIDTLTAKVENWDSPTFDVAFVAQIGRYLRKRGNSGKWPHLEYKGPMFYKLAHTSMTRWQKRAALLLIEDTFKESSRVQYEDKRGYLWSTLAEASGKKHGEKALQFPDFSSVKHFFDVFVDGNGKKAFITKNVESSLVGDFWVKMPTKKIKVMTEAEVNQEVTGDEDGQVDSEDETSFL